MSTNIQQYFQRFKRKPSSTSSSDGSPEKLATKSKPTPKKHCLGRELDTYKEADEESVMELSSTLEAINNKLEKLATKDDLKVLADLLGEKLQKLEEKVLALETEKESVNGEIERVKAENLQLKRQIETLARNTEKHNNDQEQYSRRWNLRIFGVKESPGENCAEKCLQLFNEKVKVATKSEDVQVAHRVRAGEETGGAREVAARRPRAIIVQFSGRKVRDDIIKNRRVLARSGVVIAEDLTLRNFKLLKRVQEHSAVGAAWPSNGKIIALLKNGKKVRVDIGTDLDRFLRHHME